MVFATLAASLVLMYSVKATGTQRVWAAGELEGLDLHEHGMVAYPEYVIHGYDPVPHGAVAAGGSAAMEAAKMHPARSVET